MRNPYAKIQIVSEFVSCPGDRYHVVYSSTVLPDGTISLRPVDKIDIKQQINSYVDSCDMRVIISRLLAGDTSVLNSAPPNYGDFTRFPTNYAEVLQLGIDAENNFNKLPLSVRQQFGNDFRTWFSTAGSDDWFSKMQSEFSDSASDSTPEKVLESEVIKE